MHQIITHQLSKEDEAVLEILEGPVNAQMLKLGHQVFQQYQCHTPAELRRRYGEAWPTARGAMAVFLRERVAE